MQQVQQVVPHFSDEHDSPRKSLGAFHPKVCLFVTSVRLVVVVSTANLVPQATADLSWVQAFPRRPSSAVQHHGSTSFGRALTNFLERIEESLEHQQLGKPRGESAGTVANGPLAFLRRHVGSAELDVMVRENENQIDYHHHILINPN